MGLPILTENVPCSLFPLWPKFFSKPLTEMPKSKAELTVEIRELIKGTPMRMPLSGMKRHELEAALAVAQELKAKGDLALGPPHRRGPVGQREIPVAQEEDEEGNTVVVPQLPTERLKKAPLIMPQKSHPKTPGSGYQPKPKQVSIEEPSVPTKSGRKTYCPCNCPACPHK